MLKRDYDGQVCSIARTLEIVGERWTLLIVRDAFLGLRRFDQFQESLGIARNVLTDRLNRLVEEGILERVRYSERPERHEYLLTEKGREPERRPDGTPAVGRRVRCRPAAARSCAAVRRNAGAGGARAARTPRPCARTRSSSCRVPAGATGATPRAAGHSRSALNAVRLQRARTRRRPASAGRDRSARSSRFRPRRRT